MADMAKKQIYPAVSAYVAELCANYAAKKSVCESIPCESEQALIKTLATDNDKMMAAVKKMETDLADIPDEEKEASQRMAHVVVPDMEEVRKYADEMETLCSKDYWPFPTYSDLLFSIK
jgi:glutamine synthetase